MNGEAGATTVFGYNTANELTSQTVGGTTTSFTYDDWGRMATKAQGNYQAMYGYRFGNFGDTKLNSEDGRELSIMSPKFPD